MKLNIFTMCNIFLFFLCFSTVEQTLAFPQIDQHPNSHFSKQTATKPENLQEADNGGNGFFPPGFPFPPPDFPFPPGFQFSPKFSFPPGFPFNQNPKPNPNPTPNPIPDPNPGFSFPPPDFPFPPKFSFPPSFPFNQNPKPNPNPTPNTILGPNPGFSFPPPDFPFPPKFSFPPGFPLNQNPKPNPNPISGPNPTLNPNPNQDPNPSPKRGGNSQNCANFDGLDPNDPILYIPDSARPDYARGLKCWSPKTDLSCGNVQESAYHDGSRWISYDCGNCNYEYTANSNGVVIGAGSGCHT